MARVSVITGKQSLRGSLSTLLDRSYDSSDSFGLFYLKSGLTVHSQDGLLDAPASAFHIQFFSCLQFSYTILQLSSVMCNSYCIWKLMKLGVIN